MATVLLADDEAAPRDLVGRVAREMGHDVVEARSGPEALDLAGRGGIALLVVDHALPGLGGGEVLEALRVRGDKTPAIVLLTDFKRATLASLMRLGVADLIAKPLREEELREKLQKHTAPQEAPAATPQAPSVKTAPSLPETGARLAPSPAPRSVPQAAAASPRSGPVPVPRSVPATPTASSGALAATKAPAGSPRSVPAAARAGSQAALLALNPGEPAEAKVLIVDHMEAARQALCALIPEGLGVHSCATLEEAQLRMRARRYRVIFFDVDLPVSGLPALIDHLKQSQKEAVFVGVAVAKEDGSPPHDDRTFDELVTRPFDEAQIAGMADQFSGTFQLLVTLEGESLLRVAAFRGRRSRLDAYLEHLEKVLHARFQGMAEACIDQVVIDLSSAPAGHAARVARFAAELLAREAPLGLSLRLVAGAALQDALRALPEGRLAACFDTVEAAQSAAAIGA
jgi:CheY-like chemotaxis protein